MEALLQISGMFIPPDVPSTPELKRQLGRDLTLKELKLLNKEYRRMAEEAGLSPGRFVPEVHRLIQYLKLDGQDPLTWTEAAEHLCCMCIIYKDISSEGMSVN
jgi:hypothetical protein